MVVDVSTGSGGVSITSTGGSNPLSGLLARVQTEGTITRQVVISAVGAVAAAYALSKLG